MTSSRSDSPGRRGGRLALVVLACAAGIAAVVLGRPGADRAGADVAPAPVAVEAPTGPGMGARLIGAAPQGESGDPAEAWAARAMPAGWIPGTLGERTGLKLLRYTRADGWRYVDEPLDAQGQPYAFDTLPALTRATPRGAIGILVEDDERPEGERRVLLLRNRGARLQALPAPDDGLLLPRQGSLAAEEISLRALAVRDVGDRAEAFLAVGGRSLQTGVLRWSGERWSRETICVADGDGAIPAVCAADETLEASGSGLTVVALDAAEGADAWLLARAHEDARRGIVLMRRIEDGAASRWVVHELPAPFRDAATPARGIADVGPRDAPGALTAVADGVWVDGAFRLDGAAGDVTLRLAGGAVTSWCDGADAGGQQLCDHPLGFSYKPDTVSEAWAGAGPGTRVLFPVASGEDPALPMAATLAGDRFDATMTMTGDGPSGLALASPDEGWVAGLRRTRVPQAPPIADWPLPARRPLTSVVSAPGAAPGDPGAPALAVGLGGTILRYTPGQGWDREALLADGGVATPNLHGVAWPEPDFAYAVGDEGAMWRWRATTELWEKDPAAPFDFVDHLTAVAFQPGNATRGYAVGRNGVLLRYDKSWTREELPPEARTTGPLGGPADIYDVAFAGGQALAAAGSTLLVNDGAGWRADAEAQALGGSFLAVAGLPDGGAVAAGRDVVLVRDGAGGPWRRVEQPLTDHTVVAAAAVREGDRVRAVVSATLRVYPATDEIELPVVDPNAPPPRLPAFTPAWTGTVLRETAAGWHDLQRRQYDSPTADKPYGGEPVLAMALDGSGRGWLAGGSMARRRSEDPENLEAQTASIQHLAPAGDPARAPGQTTAPVALAPGPVRLAVGGGARCEQRNCEQLATAGLMPDRTLTTAVTKAAALAQQPAGPRALLYTGGHTAASTAAETDAQAARQAGLLSVAPSLPVFSAVASSNSGGASTLAFQRAFAGFASPFGEGPAPSGGIAPVQLAGAGQPQPGLARTHYAFDSSGEDGTVRVIVIDNGAGSLAAADPLQNPVEPGGQAAWLRAMLADARANGIPAVVMGSRSLSVAERQRASVLLPDPNVADDAAEVAAILADGGASAYVYESPERQVASVIPDGAGVVPSFGAGSLGYRGVETQFEGYDVPGLLLLELDLARRDPATNRAPAAVRLVPVLEDLAIDAVDGRVLNRSQPALFRGLGRRPRSGDRYAFGGRPQSSQYVDIPGPACPAGCPGRIDPEARFVSSDPDVADFVRIDTTSTNPRKPYIDPVTDKVVADASSGLLCAFNAGTTTVRVEAGGLSYSTTVTVRGGSALRPCGTMPLAESKQPRPPAPPNAAAPPPPPTSPPVEDDPAPVPPPVPEEAPDPIEEPAPEPVREPVRSPPPPARPQPQPRPQPEPQPTPVPQSPGLPGLLPLSPLPPPPPTPRPIPPSGTAPVSVSVTVTSPVAQIERQREEEEAIEQSQAYARVEPDHDPGRIGAPVLALIVIAAAAGVGLRRSRRDRDRDYVFAGSSARRPTRLSRDRPRRFTR